MIPRNVSKQHRGNIGYGGNYTRSFGLMNQLIRGDDESCTSEQSKYRLGVGSMADDHLDESRTESTINKAGGSSSKDVDSQNEGWLQLGIGVSTNPLQVHHTTVPRARLVELDLLPSGGGCSGGSPVPEFGTPRPPSNIVNPTTASYMSALSYHQEINNWAFRPIQQNLTVASTSSPFTLMPRGPYFTGPFQIHGGSLVDSAGPSLDSRFVDPPPRRPHSAGLWFALRASQNQPREPFLPQIPKSYLRIKDGRMTVRLLMKYLAIKLKLDSESEIEVTCRGQQLLPFLTLQHVRDHIWRNPRDRDAASVAATSSSSTTDHVLVLHYARSPS